MDPSGISLEKVEGAIARARSGRRNPRGSRCQRQPTGLATSLSRSVRLVPAVLQRGKSPLTTDQRLPPWRIAFHDARCSLRYSGILRRRISGGSNYPSIGRCNHVALDTQFSTQAARLIRWRANPPRPSRQGGLIAISVETMDKVVVFGRYPSVPCSLRADRSEPR